MILVAINMTSFTSSGVSAHIRFLMAVVHAAGNVQTGLLLLMMKGRKMEFDPGITVVIPSIPPRRELLKRAVASAVDQIYPAAAISIAVDTERKGAWHTRNRALNAVRTEWTAFLDDDDEFKPEHLNILHNHVVNHEADMAYSWFDTVPYGGDPFPAWFADAPWNPAEPRHTTIVMLVRTRLAQEIGFTSPDIGDAFGNEDWRFILELNQRGKIVHAPQRTWLWHHDSANTSGRPDRW